MKNSTNSPAWGTTVKIIVSVLLLILTGLAFYFFRAAFIPLVLGVLIAYILTPVTRLISRLTRLPHGLSTTLVFVAVLAVVIPVGIVGVQALLRQTNIVRIQVINAINELSASSATRFDILGFEFEVGDVVDQVSGSLIDVVRSAAPNTVGLVIRSARTLIMSVFTVVIGFYLTKDSDKVAASLMGLVPAQYKLDAVQLTAEINGVWSAFLRGQVMLSALVMVILTVVSLVLGLPQPFLLGIWGGLLEFLPSIGNMIWGATAVLLAAVEGSSYLPFPPAVFVIIVIGAYVAFSQVDINILIPNIIGGQVKLHPMVVLLGVIIGLSVGGVLGVALAAPVIASLRIIGRYVHAKLFDLDPFPVVGAATAPSHERIEATLPAETQSQHKSAQTDISSQ